MFDNLKQNIPFLQVVIGYALYVVLLFYTTLSGAMLWAILLIYIWLISSIMLKTYNFYSFVYLLSSSGIIFSASMFFLTGIEELPYPAGALLFHFENIAKACFLFFISSIPLIFIWLKKKDSFFQKTTPVPSTQDFWEEATEEDLQSGEYESL